LQSNLQISDFGFEMQIRPISNSPVCSIYASSMLLDAFDKGGVAAPIKKISRSHLSSRRRRAAQARQRKVKKWLVQATDYRRV
jgi:hypothetical protein